MKTINFALQQHSVRQNFGTDPVETMAAVKAMGYDGMELNHWALPEDPSFYRSAMERIGLKCFSSMEDWENLSMDALPRHIALCKALGANTFVIGSVERPRLKTDPAYPAQVIAKMNEMYTLFRAQDLRIGYHSHDIDSQRINGTAFYEMVMDQTPADFQMIIDTGNTQAGGDDPLALLKKFPGRTSVFHLKGFNSETRYRTPIWESSLNWEVLLTQALDHCGTETVVIEFDNCGEHDPMEYAEASLRWLKSLLRNMGRI